MSLGRGALFMVRLAAQLAALPSLLVCLSRCGSSVRGRAGSLPHPDSAS